DPGGHSPVRPRVLGDRERDPRPAGVGPAPAVCRVDPHVHLGGVRGVRPVGGGGAGPSRGGAAPRPRGLASGGLPPQPALRVHVLGDGRPHGGVVHMTAQDRKSTRLNSSHLVIWYAVFCLKKKTTYAFTPMRSTARLWIHVPIPILRAITLSDSSR